MSHELAYVAVPGMVSMMDAVRHLVEDHYEQNGSNHSVDAAWSERDVIVLPGMVTQKMAYAAVSDGYDKAHNGAPHVFAKSTVAVRLYDESTITRRTVKVKVRFTGEQCDERGPRYEFLEQAAKSAVGTSVTPRTGEFLEGWKIAAAEDGTSDISLTSKVVATAPKEKAVTKYIVHQTGSNPLGRRDSWERGFASQATARAAALALVERNQGSRYDAGIEYEITPVTRRESGAALVSVKRVIARGTVTIEITLAKSSHPTRTGGWAVGADCHH